MKYERLGQEEYFKMPMYIPEKLLCKFTVERIKFLIEKGKKIYVILENSEEIEITKYNGGSYDND